MYLKKNFLDHPASLDFMTGTPWARLWTELLLCVKKNLSNHFLIAFEVKIFFMEALSFEILQIK